MFGKNLNSKMLFSMLSGFGLDINKMMPEVENFLIQEANFLEEKHGKKIHLTATKSSETTIIVGLYLQESDGSLSLIKKFPLAELLENLKNLKDAATINA